jgi:hypothetical protein
MNATIDNEDDRWDALAEDYPRGLVVVLGSGVSKASGIPMWKEFLIRSARQIKTPTESAVLDMMIGCGFTLPVIASLLEERCGRGEHPRREFIHALRTSLYEDFLERHQLTPPVDFSRGSQARKQFIEKVRATEDGNTTLRAIGALCAIKTEEFKRNPNIRAIVTLNVDWLLQAFVRAHFDRDDRMSFVRTIDRPSASPTAGKIPVYHMHGLLRFDRKQDRPQKDAPDRVVITEQDYFNVFNNPTSIFNYTILHLLREQRCLFVGLSMTDENVRRLLHYSKVERVESLEAEELTDPDKIRKKVTRHYAVLQHGKRSTDEAIEDTLAPLGTRVLWVNDFGELPQRFECVYDKAHGTGQWEAVYRGVL